MKLTWLFSLLLLPVLLFAQYPSGGIKSRLGYQTTGDGLVYRGAGAPAYSPGTMFNAWMYMDTTNMILYAYKNFQWVRVPVANNGLNMDGAYVQLGGTLVENTTVEKDSYTFNLGKVSGSNNGYASFYGADPYYFGVLTTKDATESGLTIGNKTWGFEVDDADHTSQLNGTRFGFDATYLGTLGVSQFKMDSAKFYIRGLPDFATHSAATSGIATYGMYQITNGRAIYVNTGTADKVSPNISDNGTAVFILNSKPFALGQWTTAGRPTGVQGYEGWNTTLLGKDWYNGTRWATALESTFARGTATRIPFFDANGQVTDNIGLTFQNPGTIVGTAYSSLRVTTSATATANNQFLTGTIFTTSNTPGAFTGVKNHVAAFLTDDATGSTIAIGRPYSNNFYATITSDFGTRNFIFDSGNSGGNLIFRKAGSQVLSVGSPRLAYAGSFFSSTTESLYGLSTSFGSEVGTSSFLLFREGSVTGYKAAFGHDANGGAVIYAQRANTNFVSTDMKLRLSGSTGYAEFLNNTAGVLLGGGTTAQTPSEVNGLIRYNSDSTLYQIYQGGARSYIATRAYARSLANAVNTIYTGDGTIPTSTTRNINLQHSSKIYFRNDTNDKGFLTQMLDVSGNSFEGIEMYNRHNGTSGELGMKHYAQTYTGLSRETQMVNTASTSEVVSGMFNEIESNRKASGLWSGIYNSNAEPVAGVYITGDSLLLSLSTAKTHFAGLARTYNKLSSGSNGRVLDRSNKSKYMIQTRYGNATSGAFNWIEVRNMDDDTTGNYVKFYEKYDLSNSTPGTGSNIHVWDNGTPSFKEIKRDTTVYIDDADLDWSAAITTTQIAARYNRVIFLITTTGSAASDSELTLHTPDANLMQVEYLIRSTDDVGGFTNKVQFGTNNAVSSDGSLASSYTLSAGQGLGIRAGLKSAAYKYFYY